MQLTIDAEVQKPHLPFLQKPQISHRRERIINTVNRYTREKSQY